MKKIRLARKQVVITSLCALLLASGGIFAYRSLRDNSENVATEPGQLDESGINYGPPTAEEKQQADDHKEDLVDRINTESQNLDSENGKKAVTPVITYATQVDNEIRINAYIPGVFEDGGTCTFTIKKDSQTITKTTEGFANASTTDCMRLIVDRSEFNAGGNWQVTVRYSSSTAQGTSGVTTLTVE